MKRLSYFLSILLLVTLVVFSACKDDEVSETLEEKQTRLLTSGPFTVSAVTLNPDTQWSYDGPTSLTFNAENKTFSVSGNTALPMIAEPDINFPASGNWVWKDTQNFNEITLTAGSESVDLTITNLDDNNLVFTYAGFPAKNEPAVVTVAASK